MSDSDERISSLRHKALRNALYHSARREWLEKWSRFFNFVVVVSGTTAAAAVTQNYLLASQIIPIGIAVVGALQLVYDFSGKAKDHAFLQSRYYGIMASIDECIEYTDNGCANWEAEFSRIAADAPPTLRALDATADNQATSSLFGGGPRLKISRFERLTRNILSHNNSSFPIRDDWQLLSAPTSE